MARYTGPKVKLSRRVGVPIADNPKHTSKRDLTFPGMHGYRGRRLRDYGVRLNEKQKVKLHYCVLEKQFRRFVAEATRKPGNTGDLLMQTVHGVIRGAAPNVTIRRLDSPPVVGAVRLAADSVGVELPDDLVVGLPTVMQRPLMF